MGYFQTSGLCLGWVGGQSVLMSCLERVAGQSVDMFLFTVVGQSVSRNVLFKVVAMGSQ